MRNDLVRIRRIRIENFKNVEFGEVKTSSYDEEHEEEVDILALYGQNGSGKTALIKAIAILKNIISVNSLPADLINQISCGKESSHFEFDFLIKNNNEKYYVEYFFDIVKTQKKDIIHKDVSKASNVRTGSEVAIENEILKISGGSFMTKQVIFDTSPEDVPFKPISKMKMFFGNDKELKNKLLINKGLSKELGNSFVFNMLWDFINKLEDKIGIVEEVQDVLFELVRYGFTSLCVIDNTISLENYIPVQYSLLSSPDFRDHLQRSFLISLDSPTTVPEEDYKKLEQIIVNINTVLTVIIPGLSLEIKNLGRELLKDGKIGFRFELLAKRQNNTIPLKFESEGIKKIISILHMLIVAFNNPGVTFVIDELDSGIFEYLLGELLDIFELQGKGQLIFTSHNLRPLEMIDKRYQFFTTTNPKNRYIQMTNLDSNHNVRLSYFRSILLGGQKEELYEDTHRTDIARAFRIAGEVNGEK